VERMIRFRAAAALFALAAAPALAYDAPKHAGEPPERVRPLKTTIAAPVEVPMGSMAGRPTIDVMIDGKGPFRFLVDTGAGTTVINQDLANELGLAVVDTTRIGDPMNPNAIKADVVQVPTMTIGDAKFETFAAASWDRGYLIRAGETNPPRGVHCIRRYAVDHQFPATHLKRQQVRQQAARYESTAREDGDATAQGFGVGQHVRTEEHRAAAIAQAQDERAHVAAAERIEPRHRLVEKEHLGIVQQRLREADALEHPLRELAQRQPALGGDADAVERGRDAAPPIGGVHPEQPAVVVEQLLGGQVIVEVGIFRQVADAAADGDVADGASEDLCFAAGGKHQLHQQLQRRRLAGAVGTEKAEDLARLDFEAQTIESAIGLMGFLLMGISHTPSPRFQQRLGPREKPDEPDQGNYASTNET